MTSRTRSRGIGIVPVIVIVLILLLIGGGVGLMLFLKQKAVADAIAAFDQVEPPQNWSISSKKKSKDGKRKKKAWAAMKECTQYDTMAVGPLLERLKGSAGPGLEVALVALGDLEAGDAVEPMIGFLKGDDERASMAAAYGLARFNTMPKAVSALMKDAELSVAQKTAVYRAHAWSRSKTARRQVVAGVEESDPTIRKLAVGVLGRLGGGEVHEALVKALEDEVDEVADAAAQQLIDRSSDDRSKDGRKTLRALVKHERAAVRARALEVCAATYEINAAKRGETQLDDPDPRVAAAAAKLMMAAQREEAAPKLVAMLTRPEPAVVEAASAALKKLGGAAEGTDKELLKLLDHKQIHTRIAAAALVAYLDDLPFKKLMKREPWVVLDNPWVDKLLACLQSGDATLADAANNALTALQKRTHFPNSKRTLGAWQEWHKKLQKEVAVMEKIWAICDAAAETFEKKERDHYKQHIPKLREAVNLYGDLIEEGASTNYEYGDYGIKEINKLLWIMEKTAGGMGG